MKKRLLTVLVALMGVFTHSNAQISVRTEGKVVPQQEEVVYDSLSNIALSSGLVGQHFRTTDEALAKFNGELKKYIGQRIYIMPLTQRDKQDKSRISDGWDHLRGSYYIIDNFDIDLDQPSYLNYCELDKVIFQLKDDNGNKHKWAVQDYLFLGGDFDEALLVGYYEKLKQRFVGKSVVYTGRINGLFSFSADELQHSHSAIDTKTGQVVKLSIGDKWQCVDLQFVDDDFLWQLYMVLTNSEGNEILARLQNTRLTSEETNIAFFSCFETQTRFSLWKEMAIKKYGKDNAQLVLERKVKIGMTDEMCLDSWGEPKSRNKTILNGKISQQWVYNSGTYLYFDNGILTAIQN